MIIWIEHILVAIFLVGLALMAYGHWIEPHIIDVTHHKLDASAHLNKPLRLVHLTDMHLGKWVSATRLEHIIDHVNALSPDLVVITGDTLDNFNKGLDIKGALEAFKLIKATHPVVITYGNHEYEHGGVNVLKDLADQAGMTLLKNQVLDLEGLKIYGADCAMFGDRSVDFVKNLDPECYNLLLLHQPDAIHRFDKKPFNLVLSGHTHNGQVKLPLLGTPILPEMGKKYLQGWYNQGPSGTIKHYVNRGLGMTMLPFRFMSPPEIAVFDLLSDKQG